TSSLRLSLTAFTSVQENVRGTRPCSARSPALSPTECQSYASPAVGQYSGPRSTAPGRVGRHSPREGVGRCLRRAGLRREPCGERCGTCPIRRTRLSDEPGVTAGGVPAVTRRYTMFGFMSGSPDLADYRRHEREVELRAEQARVTRERRAAAREQARQRAAEQRAARAASAARPARTRTA